MPASSGASTMAGAAPAASSTFAVKLVTTLLVMQCTSGDDARTASTTGPHVELGNRWC